MGHSNLFMHLARLFALIGQALRRKIPFAAISEDLMASLALEIVGQFLQFVLIVALSITYLGFSGYPVSATFCVFYWLFLMGHYFSIANAFAKKENIQKWIDVALFAYGAFSFISYVVGNTLLQKIASAVYFLAMIGRYGFYLVWDCIKASKVVMQIGGVTVKKE